MACKMFINSVTSLKLDPGESCYKLHAILSEVLVICRGFMFIAYDVYIIISMSLWLRCTSG